MSLELLIDTQFVGQDRNTQQKSMEKVADEALDATTSQCGRNNDKQGESYCLELPCEVKKLGRLDVFSLVRSFVLHALFEKVVDVIVADNVSRCPERAAVARVHFVGHC